MTETTTRPGTGDAEGYFLEGAPIADTKAPGGPIGERWAKRRSPFFPVPPLTPRLVRDVFSANQMRH